MKKYVLSLLLSCFALGSAYAEPENLDTLKVKLIRYHDDGEYEQALQNVAQHALSFLQQRVAKAKSTEKLAIVLDIDETSLSNFNDMVKLSFGGTLDQINAAENKGTDPVIAPTRVLYQYAKDHQVAVFFITGRTQLYRAATERNLADAGYKHFDGLTLKPDEYHMPSVVTYKSLARKAIVDQGYTIVLNMGDQDSDLAGGYAEKTFKLPNPFYFIP